MISNQLRSSIWCLALPRYQLRYVSGAQKNGEAANLRSLVEQAECGGFRESMADCNRLGVFRKHTSNFTMFCACTDLLHCKGRL